MYEVFKSVIQSGGYDDLNSLLFRLRRAWARGTITEEELEELEGLAKSRGPVKKYDVQKELDALCAAVRRLQEDVWQLQAALSTPAEPAADEPEEPEPDPVPEFVQPTGAHDAYQIDDRVTYGGAVYVSLMAGNVWSPDVYPAGWQREEAAEE